MLLPKLFPNKCLLPRVVVQVFNPSVLILPCGPPLSAPTMCPRVLPLPETWHPICSFLATPAVLTYPMCSNEVHYGHPCCPTPPWFSGHHRPLWLCFPVAVWHSWRGFIQHQHHWPHTLHCPVTVRQSLREKCQVWHPTASHLGAEHGSASRMQLSSSQWASALFGLLLCGGSRDQFKFLQNRFVAEWLCRQLLFAEDCGQGTGKDRVALGRKGKVRYWEAVVSLPGWVIVSLMTV